MGVFTSSKSSLYQTFKNASIAYSTLKFIQFTDNGYFKKNILLHNSEIKRIFNRDNEIILIVRKEELVKRHIKMYEPFNPNSSQTLFKFIETTYLIDVDVFNFHTY